MRSPGVFPVRMLLFLTAVGGIVAVLFEEMAQFFMSNPALNGVILGVGLLGTMLSFRNVLSLGPDVRWLKAMTSGGVEPGTSTQALRLLAPVQSVVAAQGSRSRFGLSAISTRALLDGISTRLDENRETARYFVGLTIFLGLLGTFWGLLQTIEAIAAVIGNMSLTSGDLNAVFSKLQAGLGSPLAGMGTAFSSSLFGLSASLVLGFLDLQAGQAQNSFYNGVEDWLSEQTRFAGASGTLEETGQPVPAYIQALLEKTADSLDDLQRTIARGTETTLSTAGQVKGLSETMVILTDQMRTEQQVLLKLAQTQADLRPLIKQLAGIMDKPLLEPASPTFPDQLTAHVRNIDTSLDYIANQAVSGREAMLKELRAEIRMLARTIASQHAQNRASVTPPGDQAG